MELKHFTKSILDKNSDVMNVSINMYSTTIVFNEAAVDQLGLKVGKRIIFTLDNESDTWYFFVTSDQDSFPLRKYAASEMLAFNCKNLCKSIIKSVNEDAYKIGFTIPPEPLEFNGIQLYKLELAEIEKDEFFTIETCVAIDKKEEEQQKETTLLSIAI